jgi:hypothetical protein
MLVTSNSAENRQRRLAIEALALDLADFVRVRAK